DQDESALAALESARGADVIVKASGIGIYDELLERAVLEASRPGQLIIFWDVDAPATLARLRENPADPFRELIPQYDLILTYGGGRTISGESMPANGFGPPARGCEAGGAGACVIPDAWQGIGAFLEPDRECLVAETDEQVVEHLRALTDARAREIGAAARRRIL